MRVEDIDISSGEGENARTLKATLFSPETETTPGILYLPGYRSRRTKYEGHARTVAEEIGATCLTVDISGHGETPGDLHELKRQDLYDDVAAAYDALAEQPAVDAERVGVVGTSFGAHLAVWLTQKRDPRSLLLRAPAIKEDLPTVPEPEPEQQSSHGFLARLTGRGSFPSLYDVVSAAHENTSPEDRLRSYLPREGLLRVIADYQGPITIVESERDEHIKHKYIEACLAVANNGTHRVIEGAKHTLEGNEHLIYRQMILSWAKEL